MRKFGNVPICREGGKTERNLCCKSNLTALPSYRQFFKMIYYHIGQASNGMIYSVTSLKLSTTCGSQGFSFFYFLFLAPSLPSGLVVTRLHMAGARSIQIRQELFFRQERIARLTGWHLSYIILPQTHQKGRDPSHWAAS